MSARSVVWVCLALALGALAPSSAFAGAATLQMASAPAHTSNLSCSSEKRLATGSRRSRRRVGGGKAKASISGCSVNRGPKASSARRAEERKAFTVRAARRSRKRSPSTGTRPVRGRKK